MKKLRVGVVGLGRLGKVHAWNIAYRIPNAELAAVCSSHAGGVEYARRELGMEQVYPDYREMLEKADIDAVVIVTTSSEHCWQIEAALDAGKHVFCEKAMARTLDECKAIYDAYQKTDRALYFCMQRMYDPKYIKGMQLIRDGVIGEVVGMRCHWFRNADWRREVPSPELERAINWRLYKESSGGLMTELACHQLEVCNMAAGKIPQSVTGMGDIIYWKDGREVYDAVNVIYRYSDGRKINYESLISNKFNGMEDQILGHKGTMDLTKGVYYLEEDNSRSGIETLIGSVRDKVFSSVPLAGPSWRPEVKGNSIPHAIIEGKVSVNGGQNMIGVDNDASDTILSAFCTSCITGEKAKDVVEEAYCSTVLCLLGNKAMEEQRTIIFPDYYKIPYMKF